MESMTFGLMQGKDSESFFMAEPLVEAKPFIMAEPPVRGAGALGELYREGRAWYVALAR